MTLMPTPWMELLSRRVSNVEEAYGPNSPAVIAAFSVLSETPWLEHVGEPWLEPVAEPQKNDSLIIVHSWSEALTLFDDDVRYNVNGLLQTPCDRVDDVLAQFPERRAYWQKAREDIKRYVTLSGIPDSLPQEKQDLLFETFTNLYRCFWSRSPPLPRPTAHTSVNSSHGFTRVTSLADGMVIGQAVVCVSTDLMPRIETHQARRSLALAYARRRLPRMLNWVAILSPNTCLLARRLLVRY